MRRLTALTWLVFTTGLFFPTILQAQAFNRRSNTPEVARVLMLAPREYQQQLKLAERALEEQQFSEAIEHLADLLHASTETEEDRAEDFFVGKASDNHLSSSLRAQARRLLGQMPPAGRELYELQYGADARRQLQEALKASDLSDLSDVSRKYFHTQAGYTATMLLGRFYTDLSRPLAAAMCFSRLLNADDARKKYDPELSLLLAQSWQMSGMPEKASEVLKSIRKRNPDASFSIRGEQIPIFTESDDPIAWLDRVFASPAQEGNRLANEWHMHRGVPSRNAQVDGSLPLLRTRWRVQVANDPDDEAMIARLMAEQSERNQASIPTISPLIVDGVLLMKTSENMMAIDFATGKRIWEYPWSEPIETLVDDDSPVPPTKDARLKRLEERLWLDSIYGQMASDGKTLFLIDDLGYAQSSAAGMRIQMMRGMRIANPNQPQDYNALVALDVRTQGKYRWRVGGINGEDEPKLAKAFFLGAPLVLAQDLYILAEVRGDVSLFVLDSQTGKIRWSQQLAHVGQFSILNDPVRRLAGATPSYSDGVLICPTSAGAIVAIDVPTRSLLWGYQYQRNFNNYSIRNGIRINRTFAGSRTPDREKWIDSTATLSDGKVIITPPEGGELHCLDLLTGKPAWKAKQRDGNLYLACIHEGKAVLVGKQFITAINMSDGTEAWQLPVGSQRDSTGIAAVPTGRGFLSGNQYYLPTNLELMQIDVKTGTLQEAIRTELPLGNLLSYRDHIISLGPDYVTAYSRGDRLKLLVEEQLANNPNDPWSIEQRGLLLLDEGQSEEALRFLRQAFELYAPEDDRRESAKTLLVDTLLEALETDFANNGELAGEVSDLIDRPLQREKYLRLMGKGLLESGKPKAAFDAYLELAFHQSETSSIGNNSGLPLLENGSRMHLVRRDRFVRSGIRESLRQATSDQQAEMNTAIESRLNIALNSDSPGPLEVLLAIFADHETSHRIRLELATRYLKAGKFLHSEFVVGPLLDSEQPEIAAPAWAISAAILTAAQQDAAAAECLRQLQQNWPNQICYQGQTVEEIIAGLPQDSNTAFELTRGARWPYGRVAVEPIKAVASNLTRRFQPYAKFRPIPILEQSGAIKPRFQVTFDTNAATSLVIKDTLGREKTRINQLRNRTQRLNENSLTCKTLGHLLLLNLGQGVVAANTLQTDLPTQTQILWPDNYNELLSTTINRRTMRTNTSVQTNAWGQNRTIISGRRINSIGPVSYDGVLYQQGSRLICVDPLTGETLWKRQDLSADSQIWGDAEFIFVSARNTEEATVFRTLDGEQIGRCAVPEERKRWKTVGRQILTWTEETVAGEKRWDLKLFDPWTEENAWKRSFQPFSKGFVTQDNYLAIVEPQGQSGKLTVLALEDGEVLVSQPLKPFLKSKSPSEIYLLPSEDQWLVVIGFPPVAVKGLQVNSFPDGGSAPLIDAQIYAFDRRTGEPQWEIPAVVEGFSLPLDQPQDLPVLAFVRQEFQTGRRNGRSRPQLALLCLDKRDGRVLMDIDKLNFSYGGFRIEGNDADKSVSLQLQNVHNYRLQFSQEPQAPEPPAQMGSTSGRTKGTGLSSVVGAVIGAIGKQVQQQGKQAEDGVMKIIKKQPQPDPPRKPKPDK
ncbi:MAG: PQQ-binding-like beta-propeller repeat protein [Planctomycetaceae bacterium]|nr:PQQ-binding-like beta-propeller repeat protein [Planctomycetaceae bacterium]